MSVTDKIIDLVQDYNSTTVEAKHLDYLMGLRKDISIRAFFLGKEVALLKRDFDAKKAERKISFYRVQEKHLDDGIGKSVVYAEKGIGAIRKEEARLEGNYMGSKIILEQVNQILSSIAQDISQLKAEYKADM